jgi:hypothetical protein
VAHFCLRIKYEVVLKKGLMLLLIGNENDFERKMTMKYTYITDYKNNDKLRKSFNELAEKTFGMNFIEWYANGFWDEKYILHSLVHDEKVIANVFVNLMDFDMEGTKKHYIQLGTIMTDVDYRAKD